MSWHNPSRIDAARTRIQRSNAISDRDREALIKFSDELEYRRYSANRYIKLLQHCTLAGSSVKYDTEEWPDTELMAAIGEDEASIEAAKDLVLWINRNYENEDSNRDFRVALRMFGGHITPGDP